LPASQHRAARLFCFYFLGKSFKIKCIAVEYLVDVCNNGASGFCFLFLCEVFLMYKGFTMIRPQTKSVAHVMFDDESLEFMAKGAILWQACHALKDTEDVQDELKLLAKTIASHTERIANDYVGQGWKFHDLLIDTEEKSYEE
tara:strand:- start:2032 stop:2460 length:429 start_codon:yes stop_codon:yes gene_type:complete